MTDLIETDAAAFTTEVDFSRNGTERPPRRNADGYELGVCRACGQEASTPQGTYCDEHKTRQRKTSGEGVAAPTGTDKVTPPKPVRTGKGAPSGDEWSAKVFDKLCIMGTMLFAGAMVRRYNLNDPDDGIADSLAMTDDEARRVAKPLGRFMAGTKFSKTQGRKVLENSDLLDAAFALYDYTDRVNKTLRTYTTNQPLASVTPMRQPAQSPEGGAPDGPTQQETPELRIDGDFPDLTGSIYVP